MRIVVRAKAADDLASIFEWIAQDNPKAAIETVRRIRHRIGRLGTPGLAHMGRPGLVTGTRELVEAPFIIVSDGGEELAVLAVFTARRVGSLPIRLRTGFLWRTIGATAR